MDGIDEKILELMKDNARISFQELGEAIGMSRVAAKKRVQKLEREGIIRGYNTCICKEGVVTLFIDVETTPDSFEDVLRYVSTQAVHVRQVFRTTKENHIHIVAVSDSLKSLRYLMRTLQKKCGNEIIEIQSHAVKEVIKDVYGGIRYEQRSASDRHEPHESVRRRES